MCLKKPNRNIHIWQIKYHDFLLLLSNKYGGCIFVFVCVSVYAWVEREKEMNGKQFIDILIDNWILKIINVLLIYNFHKYFLIFQCKYFKKRFGILEYDYNAKYFKFYYFFSLNDYIVKHVNYIYKYKFI